MRLCRTPGAKSGLLALGALASDPRPVYAEIAAIFFRRHRAHHTTPFSFLSCCESESSSSAAQVPRMIDSDISTYFKSSDAALAPKAADAYSR